MYRDEIFLKLNKHTGFNKHTGVIDFAQKQEIFWKFKKSSGKFRIFLKNLEKIRKNQKYSEKIGKNQKKSEIFGEKIAGKEKLW